MFIITSLMVSAGLAGCLNWKLFGINSRVDEITIQFHEIGTQVGEIGDSISAMETQVGEMQGTPDR